MHLTRTRRLVRSLPIAAIIAGATTVAACGGASLPKGDVEHGGQSSLIDKSFAGQNRCSAKNHERPFIIEWDATDMSSFQSHTSNDVVFVKYVGCELQVLDSCRDDSVKGSLGSYKPVDWTSGSVETLDISDEGELYAKLPLGAASLDGRVKSGEKFHMEYYVSGTRNATRDKVYRKDLTKLAGCAGATHFVYGYNLGAFALGSTKSLKGEVNGSYFGFGAGGSKATETKADKKGGELAACKGESSKEVETCKVPIRLTLREISNEENPDVTASQAPETPDAANLAGKLKAETDKEKKAAEHLQTAQQKLASRDGKSCIAELDNHDKLDPRPMGLSTNPKAGAAPMFRAQCLMLAGQCSAGKQMFRKQQEASQGASADGDQIDKFVDVIAGKFCQGGTMSDRDQFLKARMTLTEGAWQGKKDVATCQAAYQTIMRLRTTVKPKDDEDSLVKDPLMFLLTAAPTCLARAGDCDASYKAYAEIASEQYKDQKWSKDPAQLRRNFESLNKKCAKGAAP